MLDERREQQLIALIGRVEELERVKKDQDDLNALELAIHSWTNLLVPIASGTQTLSGTKKITHSDTALQVYDCNGGERTVLLPAPSKGNKFYILINNSS